MIGSMDRVVGPEPALTVPGAVRVCANIDRFPQCPSAVSVLVHLPSYGSLGLSGLVCPRLMRSGPAGSSPPRP